MECKFPGRSEFPKIWEHLAKWSSGWSVELQVSNLAGVRMCFVLEQGTYFHNVNCSGILILLCYISFLLEGRWVGRVKSVTCVGVVPNLRGVARLLCRIILQKNRVRCDHASIIELSGSTGNTLHLCLSCET